MKVSTMILPFPQCWAIHHHQNGQETDISPEGRLVRILHLVFLITAEETEKNEIKSKTGPQGEQLKDARVYFQDT
jgi:hypothetical protein